MRTTTRDQVINGEPPVRLVWLVLVLVLVMSCTTSLDEFGRGKLRLAGWEDYCPILPNL